MAGDFDQLNKAIAHYMEDVYSGKVDSVDPKERADQFIAEATDEEG